ncbi:MULTISPECIES: EamA family transporter [Brevibacillus]|jgi:drug/metabolite transporter (DMT)-like permease|uniref:EamA family transporter n=1 Tax=Brevibacillus TaxID=55080 RepID=UPI001D0A2E2B|nr:EamA family transporter [Brevibacillus borstelensis]MCC0564371.1 EamA family transporter [Brevibacillus borstelensis]MCM3560428.1 EamA family transporter [Brevibacillus borstelensis]MED1851637.1 EamA family transporter [Brevibacillus borstelensis]
MFSSLRVRGFTMVIVASILWGVSGTVAQSLMQHYQFQTDWLVASRLLASGLILLALSLCGPHRQNVWRILFSGGDLARLLLFSIAGMLAVQYTYFASIEAGNAATATLLQYLGPVFLVVYLVIKLRQLPSAAQVTALILALGGTYLLITGGNPGKLTISAAAVIWGLASALALAFYTVYPKPLLGRWGSTVVLGWAMLIGGIGLCLAKQPWQATDMIWSVPSVLAVVFIVLFGTLIPFYLYVDSLNYIRPTETSLLACAEPLSAVITTVVWLHVSFGMFEWIGGLCIIGTIFALSRHREKAKEPALQNAVGS